MKLADLIQQKAEYVEIAWPGGYLSEPIPQYYRLSEVETDTYAAEYDALPSLTEMVLACELGSDLEAELLTEIDETEGICEKSQNKILKINAEGWLTQLAALQAQAQRCRQVKAALMLQRVCEETIPEILEALRENSGLVRALDLFFGAERAGVDYQVFVDKKNQEA